MANVKAEVKGNQLIITVDISKAVIQNAPLTESQKSCMIGTTGKAKDIDGPTLPDGTVYQLSVYYPAKNKPT